MNIFEYISNLGDYYMFLVTLCYLLSIMVGIFIAIVSLISDGSFKHLGDFWCKKEGKKRQWKKKDGQLVENDKRLFYYLFLYKPKYKEKFPYSSVFISVFNDAWSLFKHLYLICLFIIVYIALVLPQFPPIFAFILIKSLLGITLLSYQISIRKIKKEND